MPRCARYDNFERYRVLRLRFAHSANAQDDTRKNLASAAENRHSDEKRIGVPGGTMENPRSALGCRRATVTNWHNPFRTAVRTVAKSITSRSDLRHSAA